MWSLYKTRSTSSRSDLCLKGLTDPASMSQPAALSTNSDVSMWASRNQIFTASTFFQCPTAVQTSRVKMRWESYPSLTKSFRSPGTASALWVCTAANSGHIWTHTERQVHELWTNIVCQNTSIIISHEQAKRHQFITLTFAQNLHKTINRIAWITEKGDVVFI